MSEVYFRKARDKKYALLFSLSDPTFITTVPYQDTWESSFSEYRSFLNTVIGSFKSAGLDISGAYKSRIISNMYKAYKESKKTFPSKEQIVEYKAAAAAYCIKATGDTANCIKAVNDAIPEPKITTADLPSIVGGGGGAVAGGVI